MKVSVIDAAVEQKLARDVFVAQDRRDKIGAALGIGTLAKLHKAMKALGENPRDETTIQAFYEAFQARVKNYTFRLYVCETWSYPDNGNRGRIRGMKFNQLPLSLQSGLAAARHILANGLNPASPRYSRGVFVEADALMKYQRLKLVDALRVGTSRSNPFMYLENAVEACFRNVWGLKHLRKPLQLLY